MRREKDSKANQALENSKLIPISSFTTVSRAYPDIGRIDSLAIRMQHSGVVGTPTSKEVFALLILVFRIILHIDAEFVSNVVAIQGGVNFFVRQDKLTSESEKQGKRTNSRQSGKKQLGNSSTQTALVTYVCCSASKLCDLVIVTIRPDLYLKTKRSSTIALGIETRWGLTWELTMSYKMQLHLKEANIQN